MNAKQANCGTHFTLSNKNFPKPMKHIPALFKDFQGQVGILGPGSAEQISGPKKTFFCFQMDKLIWAKENLLSEGGQSLNSISAD